MIKKVPIEELQPGMEVAQMGTAVWQAMPFLYTDAGVIRDETHLQEIIDNGYTEAFINLPNEVEGSSEEQLEQMIITREACPLKRKPKVDFSKQMLVAKKVYAESINHARDLIANAKMGKRVDYQASVEAVENIIDSATNNPDTLVCLSKISDHDAYTYMHCVNVSALAVVFGDFLGMTRDDLRLLGMAGLLHDLGKTRVRSEVLNKPGRLTEDEFVEMKEHSMHSLKILEDMEGVPDRVKAAVIQHHEKVNGKGYPHGLKGDEISIYGRILALVDVYDALTSKRCYKDPIHPNRALSLMFGMRGQDFNTREAQLFIKCLGIYPSGSLVRMSTGHHAVVYEANPDRPLLPRVKVVFDASFREMKPRLIDLTTVDPGRLKIKEWVDPDPLGIDLAPYLEAD